MIITKSKKYSTHTKTKLFPTRNSKVSIIIIILHMVQMADILNKARLKQRSLVITLLGLKESSLVAQIITPVRNSRLLSLRTLHAIENTKNR